MKQLLPALLLCPCLLMVACGRDAPEPEPDLLGRWNGESTTDYEYDPSGKLKSQSTTSINRFYLVITGDSLRYRKTTDNNDWGSYKYSRQGKELQFGRHPCSITELTRHTLTLRFEDPNQQSNSAYYALEDHYTR